MPSSARAWKEPQRNCEPCGEWEATRSGASIGIKGEMTIVIVRQQTLIQILRQLRLRISSRKEKPLALDKLISKSKEISKSRYNFSARIRNNKIRNKEKSSAKKTKLESRKIAQIIGTCQRSSTARNYIFFLFRFHFQCALIQQAGLSHSRWRADSRAGVPNAFHMDCLQSAPPNKRTHILNSD